MTHLFWLTIVGDNRDLNLLGDTRGAKSGRIRGMSTNGTSMCAGTAVQNAVDAPALKIGLESASAARLACFVWVT